MKKVIGKEDEADTVPSAPVTSVGRGASALTQGGQSVQLGKFFFRTGNDRRVKAEEQAAERGDDGASNDQRRNGCVLC